MPVSCNVLKSDVRVYFENQIDKNNRILDVGVGCGTYSKLLRDIGYRMDGLEIWLPYVINYKLNELYDNVIIGDIMNYDSSKYDVIILGDVLEHMDIEDSLRLMERIEKNKQICLVAVPYKLEQGEHYGNKYEIHKQSDLSNEVMLSRYKNLRLLFNSNCFNYGYYINRDGYYSNDIQRYVKEEEMVSNRLQILNIKGGQVHYMNDCDEIIRVKLEAYRDDNLFYVHETDMASCVDYWSYMSYEKESRYRYVFTGEGIHKEYFE